MPYDDILLETEERMDKSLEFVHEEYAKVRGGRASPIELAEIIAVSRATFAIASSIRTQQVVAIPRSLEPSAE